MQSIETEGRIVKDRAMAGEAKIKQKRKKRGKQRSKHRVSQGGTKTVFMIPQIVNPGSNFLLLVHTSTNEVSAGFISHFPVL